MSTDESDISLSPRTPADGTAGALDGLVVVERAEGIAGPLCGKLMAGFGAEVIKVEPPSGDVSRTLGPFPGRRPQPRGERPVPLSERRQEKCRSRRQQPIAPAAGCGS